MIKRNSTRRILKCICSCGHEQNTTIDFRKLRNPDNITYICFGCGRENKVDLGLEYLP